MAMDFNILCSGLFAMPSLHLVVMVSTTFDSHRFSDGIPSKGSGKFAATKQRIDPMMFTPNREKEA